MMRATTGGTLFGFGNTLRSMTRSPLTSALNEAHRMARRHLDQGGTAVPPHSDVDAHSGTHDFELPPDVDPVEVALAIEAKMHGGRASPGLSDPLQVLLRKRGGRVLVRAYHILRLGDGRYDKGRAFLHGLMKDQRAKWWRSRVAAKR